MCPELHNFLRNDSYTNTVKLGDKERFDKEHLVLRNNFRVIKEFLIPKFDCSSTGEWVGRGPIFSIHSIKKRTAGFFLISKLNCSNITVVK